MPDDTLQDRWCTWLLTTRFAGDPERKRVFEEFLTPVRDRVPANAGVAAGDVVLDVGAGDGLIAFAALPLVGEEGRVICSDISADLLDHTRGIAKEMDVLGRVSFLRAAADDLREVPDGSVDAVTTRSVLIYVARKRQAFREFHRVLRPGGRISLFEPINRFGHPEPAGTFLGIDIRPIAAIAGKVSAHFHQLQPTETDPMVDFDERDLIRHAEAAGFTEIHLEYEATIRLRRPIRWAHVYNSSGNPNIPTLQDAVRRVLTPPEEEQFVEYLRPRIEAGDGITREAVAYLWAMA